MLESNRSGRELRCTECCGVNTFSKVLGGGTVSLGVSASADSFCNESVSDLVDSNAQHAMFYLALRRHEVHTIEVARLLLEEEAWPTTDATATGSGHGLLCLPLVSVHPILLGGFLKRVSIVGQERFLRTHKAT